MSKAAFFLFFMILTATAFSQQPSFNWAGQMGELPRAVVADDQGNVYSLGNYSGTKDFDPGPGVFNLRGGTGYLYLYKLNSTGILIWAKSIDISTTGPVSLHINSNKDLIVTANFKGSGDLDPGPGVYNFSSPTQSALVLTFTVNGNFVSCKSLNGTNTKGEITLSFAQTDKDGNIVISGSFYDEVDFDPGPGTVKMTSGVPNPSQFLAKLTSAGDLIWAKKTAGDAYIDLIATKCDRSGNIFLVGANGYVHKYDTGGNIQWTIKQKPSPTGNGVLVFWDMVVDSNGDLYFTGRFDGTMDLNPGTGSYIMKCDGGMEGFVEKISGNGGFVWAKHFGGMPGVGGLNHSIAIDAQNNIYTVGSFIGNDADYDPGPNSYTPFSFGSSSAVVLEKLDLNGNFMYAAALQAIAQNGYAGPAKITVDNTSGIYIIGQFNGSVDFDPTQGVKILALNDPAAFIVKLGKCTNPTFSTLSATACQRFTLNNQVYDSSGTYYQVIPNSANCDSNITLSLVINRKVFNQTVDICEGSAYMAGGKLQTKPGLYYDTIKLSGCDSVVITELVAKQKPKADFQVSKLNLCEDQEVSFIDGSNVMGDRITSYHWGFAKGDSSFSQNPVHSFHDTGMVSISMYFITSKGCVSDTLTKQLVINPYPKLVLAHSQGVLEGGTIILQPKFYYGTGLTFSWSPATYLDTSTIAVPHASPQDNITYRLTLTGTGGCSVTDSISITVLKTPVVPNAFSPNGDGINDTWKIQYLDSYPDAEVQIYNRNGQIIYRSKGYSKEWDGTSNGNPVPVATYYYVINPKNGRAVLTGSVTLLK